MGEVAGVEVDAERGPPADRRQRLARGGEVVSDFGGVDFQAELHAFRVKHVQDWVPALGELGIAAFNGGEVVGRERVEQVPDGGAGEAVDLAHAELGGGAGGVHHALCGAVAHALRVAVAPHRGGHDALVPCVNRVADRLPDQVRADGAALEAVAVQDVVPRLHIIRLGQHPLHVEMITPTGQFQPIKAPAGRLRRHILQR